MAGHELDRDTQFLNFLSIYDATGGDASAVARSGAKDQVTYSEEFQMRQTLIFFSYELRDGRWQSEGKTPEQLIDSDKPGADRIGRVLAAEQLLESTSDARFVIIPSEELGYGRNYLYVVTKESDGYRQGIAIEHQGTDAEFQNLIQHLSTHAANQEEHRGKNVDFSKPLLFSTEFRPEEIAKTIVGASSDVEYQSRLKRDVNNFPLLLQKHNDQIQELANKYESMILSHDDVRQAFWAVTTYMMESVKNEPKEAIHERNIEQAQILHQELPLASIIESIPVATRAVVRETAETVRGMAVFLRDKEKRKEGIDRIRRVFVRGKNSVDNHNAVALSLSTNQKKDRLTIEKIREKPVRIVEEIEKRHVEMRQGVTALAVIAETKVAVGAAPLILASLAQEQPKPLRAVEKSIRRHRKKEVRIMKYELRRKTKQEAKKEAANVEPSRITKERKGRRKPRKVYMRHPAGSGIYTLEKQRKLRRENGGKRVAAAELLTPSVSEKRERRERRRIKKLRLVMRRVEHVLEAKRLPEKKKTLWVALAVARAQFAALVSQGESLRSWPEEQEQSERTEQVAVAGVWFAWMLWMLVTRKDTETPKNNFKRSHPASQGESLRSQEETRWILLSIIYYLVAIREQRMHSNYPIIPALPAGGQLSNTTNSQKKQKRKTLPQHAVIFVLAS